MKKAIIFAVSLLLVFGMMMSVGFASTKDSNKVDTLKELKAFLEENQDNLDNEDVKAQILEAARTIVSKASAGKTTKKETAGKVTVELKDADPAVVENLLDAINDVKKELSSNGVKGLKFEKALVVALPSAAAGKEVELLLPQEVVNSATQKAVDVVVAAKDMTFTIPYEVLGSKEYTSVVKASKTSGKKVCVRVSLKKLNKVAKLDKDMTFAGKAFELSMSAIAKSNRGSVDEKSKKDVAKLVKSVSVEITFTDKEFEKLQGLDGVKVYRLEKNKWVAVKSKLTEAEKKLSFTTQYPGLYILAAEEK